MSLELFVYLLYCIVCLGEGVAEYASTLDPDALPQAPTPKTPSKSGYRPIAWTAIFATYTLRIGVILDLFVLVEKAEQERCH